MFRYFENNQNKNKQMKLFDYIQGYIWVREGDGLGDGEKISSMDYL